MIEHIGSNEHGWYVPVGTILDHLLLHKKKNDNKNWITHRRKKFFELHSLLTRIKYRYLIKKDDYFFKQSKDYV